MLKSFCGVEQYDVDSQEGVVAEELRPVSELLEPLSYSDSFAAAALAATRSAAIAEAYGVMAQFDFDYDPRHVTGPVAEDPVFLGSFAWHE